jgi:CRISPR/Cas system CSM-associated protein Csm2 small subunit
MPDMQDALKKAGMAPKSSEPRRASPQSFSSSSSVFPAGYPDYFVSAAEMQDSGQAGKQAPIRETGNKPVLKTELLTTLAERIAGELGAARPKMTMHQLRGFYQHVKLQEGALKSGRPFAQVLVELTKLKPIARERTAKGKIPECFEQFIVRNVDKVKDRDAFLSGFVEHFQAVVAYCAGTLEKSSR